jgi:CubicO group peptidase (beta-lactamase class C family)
LRAPVVLLCVLSLAGCSSVPKDPPPASPALPAAAVAPDPSLRPRLEEYLGAQATDGFSGSVIVARGGEVVLASAHGRGITPETAFWIASVSKQFTAAAILKLQEQGKLGVQDPITKFFNGVPAAKQGITIHHLLTHTSGLPHRYAADGLTGRDEAVRTILAVPLKQRVGEGYSYSNDGYNLLAAIVEIASGTTFEEYLGKNLLAPAGLSHTGFWGFEKPGMPVAPPKDLDRARGMRHTIWKDGKSQANWGYRGATGVFSTPADLHAWVAALRAGRVLSPESLGLLWAPHVLVRSEPDAEVYYGYGWAEERAGGTLLEVRHSGDEDWLGHNSLIRFRMDGDENDRPLERGRKAGRLLERVDHRRAERADGAVRILTGNHRGIRGIEESSVRSHSG